MQFKEWLELQEGFGERLADLPPEQTSMSRRGFLGGLGAALGVGAAGAALGAETPVQPTQKIDNNFAHNVVRDLKTDLDGRVTQGYDYIDNLMVQKLQEADKRGITKFPEDALRDIILEKWVGPKIGMANKSSLEIQAKAVREESEAPIHGGYPFPRDFNIARGNATPPKITFPSKKLNQVVKARLPDSAWGLTLKHELMKHLKQNSKPLDYDQRYEKYKTMIKNVKTPPGSPDRPKVE
jgi:hypothetical protein